MSDYIVDNHWTPANGPQSGPPGPLATRNPMSLFRLGKPGAAELALLALGLGFAYWVLRPKKKPKRRRNPGPAKRISAARKSIRYSSPRERQRRQVRRAYHQGGDRYNDDAEWFTLERLKTALARSLKKKKPRDYIFHWTELERIAKRPSSIGKQAWYLLDKGHFEQ